MADEKADQDAYPTAGGAGGGRRVGMSTFLIHGKAQTTRWDFSHHTVPPLSSSVTYRLDSAERGGRGFLQFGRGREDEAEPVYIYDRLDEPTRSILEDDLARAEGGAVCCTFSTGMAAISAALGILLKPGDHLAAFGTIYGCTYSLMTRWLSRLNISTSFCDFTRLEAVRAMVRPETRVLYAETPANPTMELVDLGALCALRDELNADRPAERKLHVLIDNTFASPYCQRPMEWGVDMVLESLTKNICGFGTDMGGAVICGRQYEEELFMYRKDFGGVLSPKSAWAILVYGLSTLTLRAKRQIDTAFKVAEFLERHPKVHRVHYPGLPTHPQYGLAEKQMRSTLGTFAPGTLLYFETQEEGAEPARARRLINWAASHSYCITLAVSLGNIRTLIEAPGIMTHSALPPSAQEAARIAPNGIRLSFGLEKAEDIICDLDEGLAQA
ncbi:MAG TPA: PLP-dependent transferase [Candidatus Sulfotelmatobacter sp.]|nr:PLP-dependent transferase [Candidatus Sulfotelmatobacter sp.]